MRDVKSFYRLIARRLAGLFEKGAERLLSVVAIFPFPACRTVCGPETGGSYEKFFTFFRDA